MFLTLSTSKAVGGQYFQVAAWPGPPGTPQPFPTNAWKQCVWVDLKELGDGPGTGVDTTCAADGSSRKPASTYGLGRFIKFQLTPAEAETRNSFLTTLATLDAARSAKASRSTAGDWAILVAMHMTSREIKRWTWATFFWSPTPDAPLAPSSKLIASARPAQLTGAARNYAHCTADLMESPPQPDTGGKNVGNSVYCYNPWLEAGFGPGDLPDSQSGTYNGQSVKNDVGMQTNCMSCHAQANFNPNNVANAPDYTGDRYVDLAAPAFKGTVQIDFLWSIQGNAQ